MANVKFGGGVVAMVGSIGGTTFARGPHGPYARARVDPTNPNSSGQQIVRGHFSSAASAWAGITDAQRLAWELYAANTPTQNRLGEQTFLSGYNWYCACNAQRLRASELDYVDPGPTTFGRPDLPTSVAVSATASATAISTAFDNTDGWPNEDDAAMFIFLTQPRSAQRNYLGPPYRLADYVLGDLATPPTSPQVGVNPWGVVETTMAQDAYAVVVRADGRISTKVYSSVTIA